MKRTDSLKLIAVPAAVLFMPDWMGSNGSDSVVGDRGAIRH